MPAAAAGLRGRRLSGAVLVTVGSDTAPSGGSTWGVLIFPETWAVLVFSEMLIRDNREANNEERGSHVNAQATPRGEPPEHGKPQRSDDQARTNTIQGTRNLRPAVPAHVRLRTPHIAISPSTTGCLLQPHPAHSLSGHPGAGVTNAEGTTTVIGSVLTPAPWDRGTVSWVIAEVVSGTPLCLALRSAIAQSNAAGWSCPISEVKGTVTGTLGAATAIQSSDALDVSVATSRTESFPGYSRPASIRVFTGVVLPADGSCGVVVSTVLGRRAGRPTGSCCLGAPASSSPTPRCARPRRRRVGSHRAGRRRAARTPSGQRPRRRRRSGRRLLGNVARVQRGHCADGAVGHTADGPRRTVRHGQVAGFAVPLDHQRVLQQTGVALHAGHFGRDQSSLNNQQPVACG